MRVHTVVRALLEIVLHRVCSVREVRPPACALKRPEDLHDSVIAYDRVFPHSDLSSCSNASHCRQPTSEAYDLIYPSIRNLDEWFSCRPATGQSTRSSTIIFVFSSAEQFSRWPLNYILRSEIFACSPTLIHSIHESCRRYSRAPSCHRATSRRFDGNLGAGEEMRGDGVGLDSAQDTAAFALTWGQQSSTSCVRFNSYFIERLDRCGLVRRPLVATRKQSLSRAVFPMLSGSHWEN